MFTKDLLYGIITFLPLWALSMKELNLNCLVFLLVSVMLSFTPFLSTGKCFLEVLEKTISKRINFFRVYPTLVRYIAYFLLVLPFINAIICLYLW